MTRILAIGTGPLLEGEVRMLGAHSLRTWNLVKPLADLDHEIALFTVPMFHDRPEELARAGVAAKTYCGFSYQSFLNADEDFNLNHLNEFCRRFQPEALLGINSGPAALAGKLQHVAPLWVDLFGHVMGEGQGKAHSLGANTHLHYFWDLEESVLRRADHFSVSSRRQGYALYGELGAVGRLNRHTFRHEFTSFIPPAYDPFHAEFVNAPAAEPGLLKDVPGQAFVVLWSGGFNTWTNIDSFFAGLEAAMRADERIHFVSTGGALYGYDELTYARFESLVQHSDFRARFHLLGWIEAGLLPAIYSRSNLALCVDSRNIETMFGTRTRILNLLAAGLPVLATRGSEIVEDLERADVLMTCEPDDPQALGQAILRACEGNVRPDDRARDHVLDHYSFTRNTLPMQEWMREPMFAPDNAIKVRRAVQEVSPWTMALSPLEARQRAASNAYAGARTRLARVRQSLLSLRYRAMPPDVAEPPVVLGPNPELWDDSLERARRAAAGSETPVRLLSDGAHPSQLEAMCCRLLDAGLPVMLEAVLAVEGLEATHNSIRGDQRAWIKLAHSLALLKPLPELYQGRFGLIALITLRRGNESEIEKVCRVMSQTFGSRVEFRLPDSLSNHPSPGMWDTLLRIVQRTDQSQGDFTLPNYRRIREGLLRGGVR